MKDNIQKIERDYLMALFSRGELPADVRLEPDDMSSTAYGEILQGIYDCEEAFGIWDCGTVLQHMYDNKSKHCGVLEHLSENFEPTLEAGARADIIRSAARVRLYHTEARKAVEAFEDNRIADGVEIARKLTEIKTPGEERFRVIDIGSAVGLARQEVGQLIEGRSTRLKFNLDLFDKQIGGVTPGSMTTIGGTTSSGKSSLVLLLAVTLARAGKRVCILSLEDPETLWGDRLLSLLADIPTVWLYTGAGLGADAIEDFKERADQAELLAQGMPIQLGVCTGATASEAINEATKLIKSWQCHVLIVDYLQAARFDLAVQRYDKSVADLSKRLKGLCNHHRIPLIVTSQVRRRQGNPFAEPHITDLKESGDLENESEIVILLWKDSDKPNARCLGKIAKIKWSQPGLRFELVRDESHGMITNVRELRGRKEDGPNNGFINEPVG